MLKWIIFQIVTILVWLEDNNFSHGDLKASNILIDDKNIVRFIDWGSVCYYPESRSINLCTLEFCAPELAYKNKQTVKSDIFSIGILIKFFIYKTWVESKEIKQSYENKDEYYPLIDTEIIFAREADKNFINKCQVFLSIDPHKRPSAREIWQWEDFSEFKKEPIYPTLPYEWDINKPWGGYKNIDMETRGLMVDFLGRIICHMKHPISVYINAIYILDKYITLFWLKDITKNHLSIISLLCYTLSMYINLDDYFYIEDYYKKFIIEPDYDKKIIKILWVIFKSLNYNIYYPSFIVSKFNRKTYNIVNRILKSEDTITKNNIEKLKLYEIYQEEE